MQFCEAQRSQNTLESLSDETFWFKLKDMTTYGHLTMEIYTVGNWIPKFWEDEKSSVPQMEQIVFEERFWTIMENKVLCAHIQHEAFKVADLIRRECESRTKPARQKENEKPAKLRQRATSCPFWKILKSTLTSRRKQIKWLSWLRKGAIFCVSVLVWRL